MLGKNNFNERLRKMEMQAKQDRFSIRKLSIGAASVLLGFTFLGTNSQDVKADAVTPATSTSQARDNSANDQDNNVTGQKDQATLDQEAKEKATKEAKIKAAKAKAAKKATQKKAAKPIKLSTYSGLSKFLKSDDEKSDSAKSIASQDQAAQDSQKTPAQDDSKVVPVEDNQKAPAKDNSTSAKPEDPTATDITGSEAKTPAADIAKKPKLTAKEVGVGTNIKQVTTSSEFINALEDETVDEIDVMNNIDFPNGETDDHLTGDNRKIIIKGITPWQSGQSTDTRVTINFNNNRILPEQSNSNITFDNLHLISNTVWGIVSDYNNKGGDITVNNCWFQGSQMFYSGPNTHIYFYGNNVAETIKSANSITDFKNQQQLFEFKSRDSSIEFHGTFVGKTYGGNVIEMSGDNDQVIIHEDADVTLEPGANLTGTTSPTAENTTTRWGIALRSGTNQTIDVKGKLNINTINDAEGANLYQGKGPDNKAASALYLKSGEFTVGNGASVNITTNGDIASYTADGSAGNSPVYIGGDFTILPNGSLNVVGKDMGTYSGTLVKVTGNAKVENGGFSVELKGEGATGAGTGDIILVDIPGYIDLDNPTYLTLDAHLNKSKNTSVIGTNKVTAKNVRQKMDLGNGQYLLLPPFNSITVEKPAGGSLVADSLVLLNGKRKFTKTQLDALQKNPQASYLLSQYLPDLVKQLPAMAAAGTFDFDTIFMGIIKTAFSDSNAPGYNNIHFVPAVSGGYLDIDGTSVTVKNDGKGGRIVSGKVKNYNPTIDGPASDSLLQLLVPGGTKAYVSVKYISDNSSKNGKAWNNPKVKNPYAETNNDGLPSEFATEVNDDGTFTFTIPKSEISQLAKGDSIELTPSANFIGYAPKRRPVVKELGIVPLSEARDDAAAEIKAAAADALTNEPANLTAEQKKDFEDKIAEAKHYADKETEQGYNKDHSVYGAPDTTEVETRKQTALQMIKDALAAAKTNSELETNKITAINKLKAEAQKQTAKYPSLDDKINGQSGALETAIANVNKATATNLEQVTQDGIDQIDKVVTDYKVGIKKEINDGIAKLENNIASAAADTNLDATEKAAIEALKTSQELTTIKYISEDGGYIDLDDHEGSETENISVEGHKKAAMDVINSMQAKLDAIKKLEEAAKKQITDYADDADVIKDALNKGVDAILTGKDKDGSTGVDAINKAHGNKAKDQVADAIRKAVAEAEKRVVAAGLDDGKNAPYLNAINSAAKIVLAKPGDANYDPAKSIYGAKDEQALENLKTIAINQFNKQAAKAEVDGYAENYIDGLDLANNKDVTNALLAGLASIDKVADTDTTGTIATNEQTAKENILAAVRKAVKTQVNADAEAAKKQLGVTADKDIDAARDAIISDVDGHTTVDQFKDDIAKGKTSMVTAYQKAAKQQLQAIANADKVALGVTDDSDIDNALSNALDLISDTESIKGTDKALAKGKDKILAAFKAAAKKQVKAAADEAEKNLGVTSDTDIDGVVSDANSTIDGHDTDSDIKQDIADAKKKIDDFYNQKATKALKAKLDAKAQEAVDRINKSDMDSTAKTNAISAINKARDTAKTNVSNAKTITESDQAETAGEVAIQAAEDAANKGMVDAARKAAKTAIENKATQIKNALTNQADKDAIDSLVTSWESSLDKVDSVPEINSIRDEAIKSLEAAAKGKDTGDLATAKQNAINELNNYADTAKKQVTDPRDQTTIDNIRDHGIDNINSVDSTKEVAEMLANAEHSIDDVVSGNDTAALNKAKKAAKEDIRKYADTEKAKTTDKKIQDAIETLVTLGNSNIDTVVSVPEVAEIMDHIETSISQIIELSNTTDQTVLEQARTDAVKELDDKLGDETTGTGVLGEIDKLTNLTTDEKKHYKQLAQDAHDPAVTKVKGASGADIVVEKQKGLNAIDLALAKAKALDAVKAEATKVSAGLSSDTDKQTVTDDVTKAQAEIDAKETGSDVIAARDNWISTIDKVKDDADAADKTTSSARAEAQKALELELNGNGTAGLQGVLKEIEQLAGLGLSKANIAKYQTQAQTAYDKYVKAGGELDKAQTVGAIQQAQKDGLDAIDQALADAQAQAPKDLANKDLEEAKEQSTASIKKTAQDAIGRLDTAYNKLTDDEKAKAKTEYDKQVKAIGDAAKNAETAISAAKTKDVVTDEIKTATSAISEAEAAANKAISGTQEATSISAAITENQGKLDTAATTANTEIDKSDLSDDEKAAAKVAVAQAVKDAKASVGKQTTVADAAAAETAGESAINAAVTVAKAKSAAKKEIAQKAEEAKTGLDKNDQATIEAIVTSGNKIIDSLDSEAEITGAKGSIETAITNALSNINQGLDEVRSASIGRLEAQLGDEAKGTGILGEISKLAGLTDKASYIQQAKDAFEAAQTAINKAAKSEVAGAELAGTTAIAKALADAKAAIDQANLDAAKTNNINSVNTAANKAKEDLDTAYNKLTDDEKAKAKTEYDKQVAAIEQAAKDAETAINQADNTDKINQAVNTATGKISDAKTAANTAIANAKGETAASNNKLKDAQNQAILALQKEQSKVEGLIDGLPNIKDGVKDKLKGKVDKAYKDAEKAVNEESDSTKIAGHQDDGIAKIDAVRDTAKALSEAVAKDKAAIDEAVQDAKNKIDQSGMSDDEKQKANEAVEQAANTAKENVDQAETATAADSETNTGKGNVTDAAESAISNTANGAKETNGNAIDQAANEAKAKIEKAFGKLTADEQKDQANQQAKADAIGELETAAQAAKAKLKQAKSPAEITAAIEANKQANEAATTKLEVIVEKVVAKDAVSAAAQKIKTGLSDADKAAVDKLVTAANKDIDEKTTIPEVDGVRDQAIKNIDAVKTSADTTTSSAKADAKKALDQELNGNGTAGVPGILGQISQVAGLTPDHVTDLQKKAKQAYETAVQDVDNAKASEIEGKKNAGISAIDAVLTEAQAQAKQDIAASDLATAKTNGKAQVDQAGAKSKAKLKDEFDKLSKDEQTKAKPAFDEANSKIDAAVAKAEGDIDQASTKDGVKDAINQSTTDIADAVSLAEIAIAKGAAKDAIDQKAEEAKAGLSKEDQDKVDQAAEAAKTAIDGKDNIDDINKAKDDGVKNVDKVKDNADQASAAASNKLKAAQEQAISKLQAEQNTVKGLIDGLPNISEGVKTQLKGKVDAAYTKAEGKVNGAKDSTEVENEKTTGINAIDAVRDTAQDLSAAVAKDKAKIDQAVQDAKDKIDQSGMTDGEKQKAKDDVDAAATTAKENVDKAETATDADSAAETGKGNVEQTANTAISNTANDTKETDKKEIDNAVTTAKGKVDAAFDKLTDAEKQDPANQQAKKDAEKAIDDAAAKAKTAIDQAKSPADIANAIEANKQANDDATTKLEVIVEKVVAKDAVKAEADKVKAGLSDTDKAAVDKLVTAANKDIDEKTTIPEVDGVRDQAIKNIDAVKTSADNAASSKLKEAQEQAISDLKSKQNTVKGIIDGLPNISDDVKGKLKDKVDTAYNEAEKAVNGETDSTKVASHRDDGIAAINKISETAKALSDAVAKDKAAIDEAVQDAKNKIDQSGMTNAEKQKANEAIEQAAQTAKDNVDKAETADAADSATDTDAINQAADTAISNTANDTKETNKTAVDNAVTTAKGKVDAAFDRLTDAEKQDPANQQAKKEAEKAIDDAAAKAKTAIDQAKSPADIANAIEANKQANDDATTKLEVIVEKVVAKDAVKAEAEKAKAGLEPDKPDEDKDGQAIAAIDKLVEQANKEIDEKTTIKDVDDARSQGVSTIKQAQSRNEAAGRLEAQLASVMDKISKITNLENAQQYVDQATAALEAAEGAISQADASEIAGIESGAAKAIDQALADAQAAAKADLDKQKSNSKAQVEQAGAKAKAKLKDEFDKLSPEEQTKAQPAFDDANSKIDAAVAKAEDAINKSTTKDEVTAAINQSTTDIADAVKPAEIAIAKGAAKDAIDQKAEEAKAGLSKDDQAKVDQAAEAAKNAIDGKDNIDDINQAKDEGIKGVDKAKEDADAAITAENTAKENAKKALDQELNGNGTVGLPGILGQISQVAGLTPDHIKDLQKKAQEAKDQAVQDVDNADINDIESKKNTGIAKIDAVLAEAKDQATKDIAAKDLETAKTDGKAQVEQAGKDAKDKLKDEFDKLSSAEQAKAKPAFEEANSKIDAAVAKAEEAINKATTKDGVKEAIDQSTTDIADAAKPADIAIAKGAAKDAIDQKAEEAKAGLSKEDQAKVDQAAEAAKNAIDGKDNIDDINQAKDEGIKGVDKAKEDADQASTDASNKLKEAQNQAISDLKTAQNTAKGMIDGLPNISDDVKTKLKQDVDDAYTAAEKAVNDETDSAKVASHRNDGINAINKISETAKALSTAVGEAKAEIDEAVQKAKNKIDQSGMTDGEKQKAKDDIDQSAQAAKKNVDKAETVTDAKSATKTGKGNVEQTANTAIKDSTDTAKDKSKNAIDQAVQDAKAKVEEEFGKLTDAEKQDPDNTKAKDNAITAIDDAATAAKGKIDQAKTPDDIKQAVDKNVADNDNATTDLDRTTAKNALDKKLNGNTTGLQGVVDSIKKLTGLSPRRIDDLIDDAQSWYDFFVQKGGQIDQAQDIPAITAAKEKGLEKLQEVLDKAKAEAAQAAQGSGNVIIIHDGQGKDTGKTPAAPTKPTAPSTVEEVADKTQNVVLMHNAYLYDSTGKRANKVILKANSALTTYGTEVINGQEYYVLVDQGANNKKYYVAIGNAKSTKNRLKHNAFVYDKYGKRVKSAGVLLKGSTIKTYGNAVKIRGHKYFTIARNTFVKAANVAIIAPKTMSAAVAEPINTAVNTPTQAAVEEKIMHNAYMYNDKGDRANGLILAAGSIVNTIGKKNINGQEYYALEDGKYIAAGNIDGKFMKLKHDAYIYSQYGNRLTKKVLKKHKSVKTYGNPVTIGKHKYYAVAKNIYIREANFR